MIVTTAAGHQSGRLVAAVGDEVQISGGEVGTVLAEPYSRQAALGCPGKYWYVGLEIKLVTP